MTLGFDALLPTLRFTSPWSYWLFYFWISWGIAWLGYWYMRDMYPWLVEADWSWIRILGVALVIWPFVKHAYGVYISFELVLDTGSVATAQPAWVWWLTVQRRTWQYIGIPLLGMFLALGLHERLGLPGGLSSGIAATLAAVCVWPRRSWVRDWVNGFGLFLVVYILYYLTAVALAPLRRLDTGDESAVFDFLTPGLAFTLAAIAGLTEEIVFRGVLQTRLRIVMPTWIAVGIQSIFFGLIHSGYGTLSHILLPALFGIAMGIVTIRFGLVPAILIHALVDLVIFLDIADRNGYGWTGVLIPFVFLAGLLLPLAYYGMEWVNRKEAAQARVRNP